MKLAILGGGGVRMPAFVRAVLTGRPETFEEIVLFEPDTHRRETTGRLAVGLGDALGHPGVVRTTPDVEEAFTDADTFLVTLPPGDPQLRQLLLAAAILVDFLWFEHRD